MKRKKKKTKLLNSYVSLYDQNSSSEEVKRANKRTHKGEYKRTAIAPHSRIPMPEENRKGRKKEHFAHRGRDRKNNRKESKTNKKKSR